MASRGFKPQGFANAVSPLCERGRHRPGALAVGRVRALREPEAVGAVAAVRHLAGDGCGGGEIVAAVGSVGDVSFDRPGRRRVGMVFRRPAPAHDLSLGERRRRILCRVPASKQQARSRKGLRISLVFKQASEECAQNKTALCSVLLLHVSWDCGAWTRIGLLAGVTCEATSIRCSAGAIVATAIFSKRCASHYIGPVAGIASARALLRRLRSSFGECIWTVVIDAVQPAVRRAQREQQENGSSPKAKHVGERNVAMTAQFMR